MSFGVASVTLGGSDLFLAVQAWHLVTESVFLRGKRGAR